MEFTPFNSLVKFYAHPMHNIVELMNCVHRTRDKFDRGGRVGHTNTKRTKSKEWITRRTTLPRKWESSCIQPHPTLYQQHSKEEPLIIANQTQDKTKNEGGFELPWLAKAVFCKQGINP